MAPSRSGTPLARSSNILQHPTPVTSSTPQPKVSFRIASAPKSKPSNASPNFANDQENGDTAATIKKNSVSNSFPRPSSPTTFEIQSKIRGPVVQFGPVGGPSAEFARLQRMSDLKTAKNQEVFPPIRNPNFEIVKTQTATAGSFEQARRYDPPLPWSSFSTPKMREDQMADAFSGAGTFGRGATVFGNKNKVDDSVLFFGKRGALPTSQHQQRSNNNNSNNNISQSATLAEVSPSSAKSSPRSRIASFRVPKMKDVMDKARIPGQELVKKRKAAAKLYQQQRPDVFLARKKDFDIKEMDFGFDTAQEELERAIADEVQRARDEVRREEEEKRIEKLRQERGGQGFASGLARRRSSTSNVIVVDGAPTPNQQQQRQQGATITPVKDLFANAILRAQMNRKNNNNSSSSSFAFQNTSGNDSSSGNNWTKAHENNTNRELSQAQRQIKMEAQAKKNDSVTKTSPARNRMNGASIGRTKRRTFLTDAQIAAVANSAQSEVIASPAKLLFSSERKDGDDNDAVDREFNKRRQAGTTQAKMNQPRLHPFRENNGGNRVDGDGENHLINSPTPSKKQAVSCDTFFFNHLHHHETSSVLASPAPRFYYSPPTEGYNPVLFSSPLRLNTKFTNRQKVVESTKETAPFTRQGARRSETEHAKLERLATKLLSPESLQKTIQKFVKDEDEHAWFRDFAADIDIDDGGASKLLKQKQRQDQIEDAWQEFKNNKREKKRNNANDLNRMTSQGKSFDDDDDEDEEEEEIDDDGDAGGSAAFGVNYLRQLRGRRAQKNSKKKFALSTSSPTSTSADHKNAFTEYFEEMNPEEDPDEDLKKYGTITSPERLERMAARELRNNLDVRRDDVALTSTGYKVVDKNPRGLTALFCGVDRDFGNRKSLVAEDPYQWEAKKLSKMYPHH